MSQMGDNNTRRVQGLGDQGDMGSERRRDGFHAADERQFRGEEVHHNNNNDDEEDDDDDRMPTEEEIEGQLRASQARVRRLRLLKELEQSRKEEEILARETSIEPEGSHPVTESNSQTPSTQPQLPVRPAYAYTARPTHAPEPKVYSGRKTIKEYEEFIGACELAFRKQPGLYTTDEEKIIYAYPFTSDRARETWSRHEDEYPAGTNTWAVFRAKMKSCLGDPVNLRQQANRELEKATMRPNQTVEDFVAYLDRLYAAIGVKDPETAHQELLRKLPDELQYAITIQGDQPRTRTELIARATRIWEAGRRSTYDKRGNEDRKTGDKRPREDADEPPKGSRPWRQSNHGQGGGNSQRNDGPLISDSNKTPLGGQQGGRHGNPVGIQCYSCGQKGHLRNACPNVECFTCHKKGHISSNCPEKQGKD